MQVEEVKSVYNLSCAFTCFSNSLSAMDQAHALDAKLTTQSVYSARGRSRKTKYTRKGTFPSPM